MQLRLDRTSGLAAYLQLAAQVREALRLGQEGDPGQSQRLDLGRHVVVDLAGQVHEPGALAQLVLQLGGAEAEDGVEEDGCHQGSPTCSLCILICIQFMSVGTTLE